MKKQNRPIKGAQIYNFETLNVDNTAKGLAYKSTFGDEAIFTYNSYTGNIIGSLKTNDGKSFSVEKCIIGEYFLKEYNTTSFPPDIGIPISPASSTRFADTVSGDNTTMTTYSVMFYYTREFSSNTLDIEDFIDQVLEETNLGI